MTALRKKSSPRAGVAQQRVARLAVSRLGGKGANQRRPHELACFLVERGEHVGTSAGAG